MAAKNRSEALGPPYFYLKTLALITCLSALLLLVSACGKSEDEAYDDAIDNARDELSASTYESEFGATECSAGCSGHNAGFEWAAQNEISEPGECGGRSQSFVEGCEAFARKLQEKAEQGY